MGYSCNAYASMCLDALEEFTKNQTHPIWNHDGGKPINGYLSGKNKPCFLERGRENKDGAITGTVFECYNYDIPNKKALYLKKGSYKITAEGIERMYGLTPQEKKRINQMARAIYARTYQYPYISPNEKREKNRAAFNADTRDYKNCL